MKSVSTVILNIPNDPYTSIGELREKLSRLRGVVRVTVNPVMEKVTVDFNPSKSTVDRIRAVVVASNRDGKDHNLNPRSRSRRLR